MTQRIICIYHANCADGFTAAWAVREALGPEVEFIPASYGSEPPEAKDADVILVDFSYKRDVLEALAERANSVLVLDHHKTAAEDLAGYPAPLGVIGDMIAWEVHEGEVALDARSHNIWAVFDTGRSGAQIAWDFFHGRDDDSHLPRPKLVDYVADRDLWEFELEHSRAIAAAVFSRPFDFPTWNEIAVDMEDQSGFGVLATEGYAIERKQKKDIADLLKATRREMTIGGHRVPVANVPYFMASDAGHIMAEDQPFAATYTDGADGQRRFSLLSYPGAEDVSKIAASYGGGGHARAAGFQMPIGWEGEDARDGITCGTQYKLARYLREEGEKIGERGKRLECSWGSGQPTDLIEYHLTLGTALYAAASHLEGLADCAGEAE